MTTAMEQRGKLGCLHATSISQRAHSPVQIWVAPPENPAALDPVTTLRSTLSALDDRELLAPALFDTGGSQLMSLPWRDDATGEPRSIGYSSSASNQAA
jgi:hypothetical protein